MMTSDSFNTTISCYGGTIAIGTDDVQKNQYITLFFFDACYDGGVALFIIFCS